MDDALVERFRADLDALIEPGARVGVAVSGGPDSLALLLLASAARPGLVEASTVDHALRPESREEAEKVAALCKKLGVPHETLTVDWPEKPKTAIQERARAARYERLGEWAKRRGLGALATAHHLDDQAETFVMRLARGAGVRGLAAMRQRAVVPGTDLPLLRPLLGWRRSELEQICAEAGIVPVADPSNDDLQFERVRTRQALGEADWLDPQAIARSAAHLAGADAALHWAATQEWNRGVSESENEILYRPAADAPREIRRRIVRRAVLGLGREGKRAEIRGSELDQVLAALRSGKKATLRGVLCTGGEQWRFIPAPKRTRRVDNLR